MVKELITHEDPKSPISEVFRALRTNIQFKNSSKGLKTLLVTSTLQSEGKSTVTANLAVTFAQAGKKTVIIDADMRKARQHEIFGVKPTPGISNYLSGIDENGYDASDNISEYIVATSVENLYIMPAGNIPPNPSELLVSEMMDKMMEKLKKSYDFIIFDGTPSLLVTDAIILSRIVDSGIIVVSHKETKMDNLQKVKRDIENVGGNIAGVVLNKVPVSINKYKDKYYYGVSEESEIAEISKVKKGKEEKKFTKKKEISIDGQQALGEEIVAKKKELDNIEKAEIKKEPLAMVVVPEKAKEKKKSIFKKIREILSDRKKAKQLKKIQEKQRRIIELQRQAQAKKEEEKAKQAEALLEEKKTVQEQPAIVSINIEKKKKKSNSSKAKKAIEQVQEEPETITVEENLEIEPRILEEEVIIENKKKKENSVKAKKLSAKVKEEPEVIVAKEEVKVEPINNCIDISAYKPRSKLKTKITDTIKPKSKQAERIVSRRRVKKI